MRLIVTGASGFVGRALVTHLASVGHSGFAVARSPIANLPSNWTFRQRDAMLQNRCEADFVIHLEVKQHVLTPRAADLEAFTLVNVKGTEQWLEWCAQSNISRFLYFSSIKAVRIQKSMRPIDESATGPGDSPYGASKWLAEEAVRHWAAQDVERHAVIVRPSVIYGPGNQANVFAMLQAIDRDRFFLAGAGQNVKSLVSLQNVVTATAHLISNAKKGCEVFNLVDRESFSLRNLGTLMASALNKEWRPISLPILALRLPAAVGDIFAKHGHSFPLTTSRLHALTEESWFTAGKLEETGYHPAQTTEEGIMELVAWYRQGISRSQ